MINEDFQKLILGKLNEITNDISAVKDQLNETNQLVKGLMHNAEASAAELNGLKVNTASKDFAKRTEKVLTLLSARAASKEDLAEARTHLIDEMDAMRSEIKEHISEMEIKINNDLKSVFEIAGEHEVKIRTLLRKPV